MKKILFVVIVAVFLFACKSEENNNNDKPIKNDTSVVEEKIVADVDTVTVVLTEEEANLKSDDLVKKSEDINNKLDELLENL